MKYEVNFINDDHYSSYISFNLKSLKDVLSPYHVKSRKEEYFSYFDIGLDVEQKGYCKDLLIKAIDVTH